MSITYIGGIHGFPDSKLEDDIHSNLPLHHEGKAEGSIVPEVLCPRSAKMAEGSVSKPTDNEKSYSNKEYYEGNKPDNKDTQPYVITYPPQVKPQQPEIEIENKDYREKYIPPNNAKAVNNGRSTSSCRLYGNISQTLQDYHSNIRVTFNPNTRCSCCIVPLEVAKACRLVISELDTDEPICQDIQGQPVDIRGQLTHSYIVKADNGNDLLRNKRFLN